MGFVSDLLGGGGDDAADASIEGAQITADAQQEALEYLKEKEAVPSWYQNQAMNALAGFYGLPQFTGGSAGVEKPIMPELQSVPGAVNYNYDTGDGIYGTDNSQEIARINAENQALMNKYNEQLETYGSAQAQPQIQPAQGQQAFIDEVMASPFYQSNIQQGENAVLRNVSATGGLRSGAANEALAQNSQNVLQNLTNQRLQGLQGFTGGAGLESQISDLISGIGKTTGQGTIAAGQAQADASGNTINNLIGLGTLATKIPWSDPKLKTDVIKIGEKNGFNIYSWKWNKIAKKLGLHGHSIGVMADEVKRIMPDAIGERSGFMTVNYKMVGV